MHGSRKAFSRAVDLLNTVLTDELVLGAKTRNYRWNINDSHKEDLGQILADQHQKIRANMDQLAKAIVSLGGRATSILGNGLERSRLSTTHNQEAPTTEMIEDLLAAHEALVGALRKDLREQAEVFKAAELTDLLPKVLDRHEQAILILSAIHEGRLHLGTDKRKET